jgi:hypothetical protein
MAGTVDGAFLGIGWQPNHVRGVWEWGETEDIGVGIVFRMD